VASERKPSAGRALELDLADVAALEHRAERRTADPGLKARECEVARQIELGRSTHRVQRAFEVPALELDGGDRLDVERRRYRALEQVVALLGVRGRVGAGAPGAP